MKEGAVVKIEKLRIGDTYVPNLRLVVKKNAPYALQLGKDVLESFGTFDIDDVNNQIIFK